MGKLMGKRSGLLGTIITKMHEPQHTPQPTTHTSPTSVLGRYRQPWRNKTYSFGGICLDNFCLDNYPRSSRGSLPHLTSLPHYLTTFNTPTPHPICPLFPFVHCCGIWGWMQRNDAVCLFAPKVPFIGHDADTLQQTLQQYKAHISATQQEEKCHYKWYFLHRRNSKITCKITGDRHRSEIRGKGLVVPC